MFGKIILSTRSAAAQAQFQPERDPQSAPKKSRSFFKKLIHIKHLLHRSPSAQKDADCKDTSQRQQAVPAPSQPAQGSPALVEDGRAGFARHANPRSSIESPRLPAWAQPSPHAQAWLQEPPTFTSFDGSTPSSHLSQNDQVIAQLHATAAYLDRRYNQYLQRVHLIVQNQVFPHSQSLANEAASAKKELKQVLEQLATVDRDCSKLATLYHNQCNKLKEADWALEKAQGAVEKTEKEHAALQAERISYKGET
ncbi:hypothetical protein FRC01_001473 [Tulasnella sp. 417]|nr:hypothetical protein FRC01_001473 [Tulasnella sp. 417]